VQFVVHAIDKEGILPTRAKFYRKHRIHLDEAGKHGIGVVTAGTLVADDGETPIGSLFVVDAEHRTTVDAFTAPIPTTSMGCGKRSKSTLIGRSAAHENSRGHSRRSAQQLNIRRRESLARPYPDSGQPPNRTSGLP
jgi:uncharacterized protein